MHNYKHGKKFFRRTIINDNYIYFFNRYMNVGYIKKKIIIYLIRSDKNYNKNKICKAYSGLCFHILRYE